MSSDSGLKDQVKRLLSDAKIKFALSDDLTTEEERDFPEYRLGAIRIILSTRASMVQIVSESDLYDDAAIFVAEGVKVVVKNLLLQLHNPAKAAEAAIEQTSTIAQTEQSESEDVAEDKTSTEKLVTESNIDPDLLIPFEALKREIEEIKDKLEELDKLKDDVNKLRVMVEDTMKMTLKLSKTLKSR